ncbi:MAG: hypothetical protein JSV80_14680, partial [Acidobacteriota bacterium]
MSGTVFALALAVAGAIGCAIGMTARRILPRDPEAGEQTGPAERACVRGESSQPAPRPAGASARTDERSWQADPSERYQRLAEQRAGLLAELARRAGPLLGELERELGWLIEQDVAGERRGERGHLLDELHALGLLLADLNELGEKENRACRLRTRPVALRRLAAHACREARTSEPQVADLVPQLV